MSFRHTFALLPLFCLSVLFGAAPAYAEGPERQSGESDAAISHDQLRDLVERGQVLSLAKLKSQILARVPGELIDVSADRKDRAIVYEFRILREGGQVTEVEVDAASGRIIEIENE